MKYCRPVPFQKTEFARRRRSKSRIDPDAFGGESLRNSAFGGTHAKAKRTLQHGEWLHVCLKSGIAKGPLSMRRPAVKRKIEQIVERTTRQSGLRISKWANVGNHIHLSVQVPNRTAYNRWIRAVSGLIARVTLGTERGSSPTEQPNAGIKGAARSRQTFWESRPFTRIVRGFTGFDRLSLYIRKNQLEAIGYTTSRAKEIMRMIAAYESYLDQTASVDISRAPRE